ncbi:MAG TPA: thermostable hemolysin [Burkholderiaceae bacterium]|nr:thermostable hemolysin [Burkholderiaceae bacterium]
MLNSMALEASTDLGLPALACAVQGSPLMVVGPGDAQRARVQQFIHEVYGEHYGATIMHFAPCLVALTDHDGHIVAAAGYRCAAWGPLYLEHYLDVPVEQALGARPVQTRAHIVEVGHLAARRAGQGRRLSALLGMHLASLGYHWLVATLTVSLRALFLRDGVVWQTLGAADPRRLGVQAVHWGRYYAFGPQVVAGHLGEMLNAVASRRRWPI